MTAVLINVATVIIGSAVGLLLKKGISEKISKAAMAAMGYGADYLRSPLTPMEDAHKEVLIARMREAGINV